VSAYGAMRARLLDTLRQYVGKPCPTNDAMGAMFSCTSTAISDGILALQRDGKIHIERAGSNLRRITFADDGATTDWTRARNVSAAAELRKCLCCDRQIFSTWAGHRMCDACKRDT